MSVALPLGWGADQWSLRSTAGESGANQDGIWTDAQTGWAVVIDGGGPEGSGAKATQVLLRFFATRLGQIDRSDDRVVRTLIGQANQALLAAVPGQGVSATLLVARFLPDRAQFWHVGDVRAYLWRAGKLDQITADHCLATLLIARGQLSREQARQHQASKSLLRYLGRPQDPEPDYTEVMLEAADRVVIVSDGVHTSLGDDLLAEAVGTAHLSTALDRLWQTTVTDDRSALIVEVPAQAAKPEHRDAMFDRLFQIITQTTDPENLLEQILVLAVEISHGDRGYIFLVDEDGGLDCRVRWGSPMPVDGESVSRSIIQKAILEGKALWIADAQHDEAFKQQASIVALNLHSALCVPLKVPKGDTEEVAGVLYVDRTSPMEILDDLRLLELLANYAGVIIQNGALYASARVQNERLRILNSLSRSIGNVSDIEAIMKDILANALRVSGADEALLLLGPHLTFGSGLTRSGEPATASHLSKSVLKHVTTELKSLCVLDAAIDEQWAHQASVRGMDLRTVMCVPLIENAALSGAIYVSGRAAVNGFSKGDLEFLEALAAHASVAMANARMLKQQQQQIDQMEYVLRLYQQAQEQAITDELTRVHNRAYLDDQFRKHFEAARRYVEPMALVMLDLDHFKRVNDTLGHQAGDEVLRRVGAILLDVCRSSDTVGRYGGEEFLVVMPHSGLEAAMGIAESLWQRVRAEPPDGGLPVTVSIGVAEIGTSTSLEGFLKRVDDALYQAKAAGRDQIVVAGDAPAGRAATP
ncbi:MAG: diguanylate cyclase [Candidatus Sericytochromatia bacterium]|nr:diguanylate cyclase [Candidatus Sericytochromatia bacterium]